MKILHITDIHIGWEPDREKEKAAWKRLYSEVSSVAAGSGKPDIMAVTGDLVMHGTEDEYRRTEEYIHGLRRLLGLEKEQVFFCCGNHDSDTTEAGSTFREYEAFVGRFYGGEIPGFWKEVPVFSVNSCKKTSLKRFNDCWLDPEDVDEILKRSVPERRGILLMHHQPEIFDDQSQIVRLSKAINLILGGHLHSGYTRQIEWKGMTAVNGMAVTPHLRFVPKGFQVVDMDEDGTVGTMMYVYKAEGGVLEHRA